MNQHSTLDNIRKRKTTELWRAGVSGSVKICLWVVCSLIFAACTNRQATEPKPDTSGTEESLIQTIEAVNAEGTQQGDDTNPESAVIQVLSMREENNYPDGMTFHLIAEAESNITQIDLYYRSQGTEAYTIETIELTPGSKVITAYTWDTSRFTVAPGSSIHYYWEIEDDAGQRVTSLEQTVFYDDLRFEWKELADSDLIVRWYEGDQSFGLTVYEFARQALDRMKAETGQSSETPILVLLYANHQDFASWHFFVEDWVGGQAFTSLGITTQILGPYSDRDWMGDVIPHEIAHLYFYQIIHSQISSWPSWLDEGFAQYYELGDKSAAMTRSYRAVRDGKLLPLSHLSGGFGHDPAEVGVAYDLSLSAVLYLIENWGEGGLQSLIELVQQGKLFRTAMEGALDVTFEQFEAGWRTWLGAPSTPAPSATPRPTFEVILPPVTVTSTP